MDALMELWCLPCALHGWDGSLPTLHHVVEGRHRLGHAYTYLVCPWHHQALPPKRMTIDTAVARYGPSLALEHKRYQEVYAPERTLVQLQDDVLALALEMRRSNEFMNAESYGDHVRMLAATKYGIGRIAISR